MSLWDNLELHEESLINIYIENLERGMNLIGKLLEENNKETELSAEFEQFNQLINNELLNVIGKLAHPQSASIYHDVILYKKRLEEFMMFPEVFQRKVIAVGGGFSAGKSKLINQIIGEELLPTDTTPTTSIPTYVIKDNQTRSFAHNIYGLKSELDEEAIQAITHAFSEKYKVSLAQIIKNILLKSSTMKYENIAILDTPGYSKSDHHKKELNKDEHLARVHLQSADCLIWVVDIEKGTIPDRDFEFIKSMNVNCPIFFVFNKADKKELSDIQKIIEVAKENINNKGVQCVGIGAVSALLQKEYGTDRLEDFLNHENERKTTLDLKEEFLAIFKKYEQFIAKNILDLREDLKQLNDLVLASSVKHEQDSLRPLINNTKNKITSERGKMKQLESDLQPFLTSLEKIQALLMKQPIDNEFSEVIRNKFLNQLLKVNIRKIIEDKVSYFIEDVDIESARKDQTFSVWEMTNLFEQALSLLHKDILVKIEKEMHRSYQEIKRQITKMSIADLEKDGIIHQLVKIMNELNERFRQNDFNRGSKKLTNVLFKYDNFSSKFEELLKEMVVHESMAIGNYMEETMIALYQDTITSMLDRKWGEE